MPSLLVLNPQQSRFRASSSLARGIHGAIYPLLLLFLAVTYLVVTRWGLLWHTEMIGDDADFMQMMKPFSLDAFLHFLSPFNGLIYRPTFFLWWNLNYSLFGATVIPLRLECCLLHGVNVALLSLLVSRLSQNQRAGLLAGLLFLIYPAKDENILWVAAGSTLLVVAGSLLTLHLWFSWLQNQKPSFFGGALGVFVLTLGAKEEAVALLPALLFLSLRFSSRFQWKPLLPFAVALLGFCALSLSAHKWIEDGHGLFFWMNLVKIGTHQDLIYKSAIVPEFWGRSLLSWAGNCTASTPACGAYDLFPVNIDGATPNWAKCGFSIGLAALVGFWAWRRREILFFFVWGILLSLPAPLATGDYVLRLGNNGRFLYPIALCSASLFAFALMALADWLRAQTSPRLEPALEEHHAHL